MKNDLRDSIEQMRGDIESARVRIKQEERYIIMLELTIARLIMEMSAKERSNENRAPT